jgi:uncharacterized protein (DUF2252 family)
MDGSGVLVFDVNDFDEASLGHFTWDLERLAASVALLGWTKALSDDDITALVETFLRGYLDQVHHFVDSDRDHEWALRLDTARGPVREALLEAQLSSRSGLLDRDTVVEDYARHFRDGAGVRRLEDDERAVVEAAYLAYLDTIPGSKQLGSLTYELKDVVGRTGFGIGSAGLPAYNLLVEGHTQALENDVVLTMKQGGVPSASRVLHGERMAEAFQHQGQRTAVSQRALQAHADPWLGWTQMDGGPHDGVGFVVAELSPYQTDLDWSGLTEPAEMAEVLEQLGRATAKVHCVSDVDDASTPLVDFQVEDAVAAGRRGPAGRAGRGGHRVRPLLRGAGADRPRAVRGGVPRRKGEGRRGDLSALCGQAPRLSPRMPSWICTGQCPRACLEVGRAFPLFRFP